jgi:5-formyltetrahydrofolate cyclo-ligase
MTDPHSKGQWRADIATRRRARPAAERQTAALALAARVLELPALSSARTVAAYVSLPTEPGTGPLLAALRDRGIRVLLPVLLADKDLDWVDAGGAPLGVRAIADADVVVCPAMAVDADGARLGKGGGSYDRALTRRRPGALVVALLHEDEVVAALPTEAHDHRVDLVVTPDHNHAYGRMGLSQRHDDADR